MVSQPLEGVLGNLFACVLYAATISDMHSDVRRPTWLLLLVYVCVCVFLYSLADMVRVCVQPLFLHCGLSLRFKCFADVFRRMFVLVYLDTISIYFRNVISCGRHLHFQLFIIRCEDEAVDSYLRLEIKLVEETCKTTARP